MDRVFEIELVFDRVFDPVLDRDCDWVFEMELVFDRVFERVCDSVRDCEREIDCVLDWDSEGELVGTDRHDVSLHNASETFV